MLKHFPCALCSGFIYESLFVISRLEGKMSFSFNLRTYIHKYNRIVEIFSLIFETKKRWLCEKKSRRGNHRISHFSLVSFEIEEEKKSHV